MSGSSPQSVRFWTDDGFEVVLADDYDALVEQLETWQEIAESSRDWRKSDEFIGLMVRARVPKEWPHSNPASSADA